MQYNPKPKVKEGSARVVEMNGHQRLMSFEENLIEVGLDQRTRIGPFVGVVTDEQTPA